MLFDGLRAGRTSIYQLSCIGGRNFLKIGSIVRSALFTIYKTDKNNLGYYEKSAGFFKKPAYNIRWTKVKGPRRVPGLHCAQQRTDGRWRMAPTGRPRGVPDVSGHAGFRFAQQRAKEHKIVEILRRSKNDRKQRTNDR